MMLKTTLHSRVACMLFILLSFPACSFATTWTTTSAGHIDDLVSWTDGTSAPATFATSGDTWIVGHAMDLSTAGLWNVGSVGGLTTTVIFQPNGTLLIANPGPGSVVHIYGNLSFTGGEINMGSSCSASIIVQNNFSMSLGSINNMNHTTNVSIYVNGHTAISGGSIRVAGITDYLSFNAINCDFSGGMFQTDGTGCTTQVNVQGDMSCSGSFKMLNTVGNTSNITLTGVATPQMISNACTGWTKTDVTVSTTAVAQLADSFSTSTGGSTNGLTVNGTLICPAAWQVTGSGIFAMGMGAALKVASPAGINGAITTTGTKTFDTDGHYTFNGATAQVTGTMLPVTLPDGSITIDNSAGVTLSQTTTLGYPFGTLEFASGILHTGAYAITVAGTVTGAGPTNYVNGTLIKPVHLVATVDYEVGDVSYMPLRLTLSSPGGAVGGFGVKAVSGIHPSVATSQLTSANMLDHYWTITNTGSSVTHITPRATYDATNIIGGSNSGFLAQYYSGGTWLTNPVVAINMGLPYSSEASSYINMPATGDLIFGNDCGMPISGPSSVCLGSTITLADATSGGTWASGTPAVATISSSGMVTGVAAGTSVMSYIVPNCLAVEEISVNNLPYAGVLSGDTTTCVGKHTTLFETVTGGVWTSSNTGVATVSLGLITGIAEGTSVITYAVTNDCGTDMRTAIVQVYPTEHCDLQAGASIAQSPVLDIHPNPNNGACSIRFIASVNKPIHLDIADITGRTIKAISTRANTDTMIMINASGLYIVTAHTDDGKRYTAKVIVNN